MSTPVLATSSTHRRNNGANCFASVQRKLVLTGARAMIHTEDLRDARVRVGRAGFTLASNCFQAPSMRNQTLQLPEIFTSTCSASKSQPPLPTILVGILGFIVALSGKFGNYFPTPQLSNPRDIVNFECGTNYCH